MGRILMDTSVLDQQTTQLANLIRTLDRIASDLDRINRQLRWEISISEQVRGRMNEYSRSIDSLGKKANSMMTTLAIIIAQYQETERKLLNGSQSGDSTLDNLLQNVQPMPQTLWMLLKEWTDSEDFLNDLWEFIRNQTILGGAEIYQNWIDIFDKIGDIGGAFEKLGDMEKLGLIGSMFALVGAVMTCGKSDISASEKLSGLFKEGLGALGDISKLKGNESVGNALGILGGGVGIVNAWSKLSGKDFGTIMREDNALIESITKLGGSIYSLGSKVKMGAYALQEKLTCINTIFSMSSQIVGDVTTYSADGVYDINDYANTLLNTGLDGGIELIKGLTFGVVSLDEQTVGDTFRKNTDWMAEQLYETGWPVGVQAAIAVPASVPVAVWSTGEVLCDYIGSGFEKIGSVLGFGNMTVKQFLPAVEAEPSDECR